jgi:hypothetical protein
MSHTDRLLLRLRDRFVRGYELLLYAFLLALTFGVVLAASPAAGEEPAQCGKTHSSSGV